jgi:hypothetical protein
VASSNGSKRPDASTPVLPPVAAARERARGVEVRPDELADPGQPAGVRLRPRLPVPQRDQAAAGPQDPRDLRRGVARGEPVEGLADRHEVRGRRGQRHRLRRPEDAARSRQERGERGEHGLRRLDRDDVAGHVEQRAGELAGPRGEIYDGARAGQAEGRRHVRDGGRRVLRAPELVGRDVAPEARGGTWIDGHPGSMPGRPLRAAPRSGPGDLVRGDVGEPPRGAGAPLRGVGHRAARPVVGEPLAPGGGDRRRGDVDEDVGVRRGRLVAGCMPACAGRWSPLRRLHGAQEATMFVQSLEPPLERGMTWSTVSCWREPQYWHVHASRAKTRGA